MKSHASLLSRALLAGALLSAIPLSGCFPVVATGVGTGILMAEDRRTPGTYVLDEEIELKAESRVRDAFGKDTHVNVISYNRLALVAGEVPNEETRAKVEEIVRGVPNVKNVQNELIVGGVTTFGSRSNDVYLTTKAKARMFDDKRFNAHHVKVFTEAGTVFLMGLLKRDEADAAAEVAAKTKGVSKVVKVFEYIE